MVDTGYVYLPKMNVLLSPFFYRQLNRNNKIISYNNSTSNYFKVALLRKGAPIKYVDNLCRVVYGKDHDGNEITDLSTKDNLDKIVKDKGGEYILYYKEPHYKLNSDNTGYDVTYVEKVDDYHTFTRVIDDSKFVHQQYMDKEHTTNANNIVDPSHKYISRNPDDKEGILLNDADSYFYPDFNDDNDNPFYLNIYCDNVSDSNMIINVEQYSQDLKLVGDDGDKDSPIFIDGFIVYDASNKFLICYGLFDETQEISGFLNIEDFNFKELLNINLTCKVGG